jgi:oligopeptide transport system permease protein
LIAFCLRRLIWMAITLWAVFTASFALMHSVPGGPFDGERAVEPEIKRNLERKFRLDQPPWLQYADALSGAVRGDFGPCMKLGDYSVNQVIREGLPISAALGVLALAFALTLGLTAGVVSAAYRDTPLDFLLRLAATAGLALPSFVVAGVAILLFVFLIPLLPAAGWGDWRQLILPAVCLGAPYAAEVARISRTSLLEALSLDCIRTARAKGAGEARVLLRHGLRNSLLPVVTYLGPAAAGIFTGSLVVETIFAIPGLGVYFVKSAIMRDYPLSLGVVMTYTLLLCTLNFLVDLSYAWLDPRVELE